LAEYPNSNGSMGLIEGMGDNLYHLGRYTEAIKYYDKALSLAPTNAHVRQEKMLAIIALEKRINNSTIALVYVKETLVDWIKQLNQIADLPRKPVGKDG